MEKSPLARLPLELRAHIFSMVFPNGETVKLSQCSKYIQLLHTCTQVRREAIPLFYGCNTFTHSFHPGQYPVRTDIASLIRQLRGIGSKALRSTRTIRIDWFKYSAEYNAVRQFATIQQQCPSMQGETANTGKRDSAAPERHFRPGHVESEIIDLYRMLGIQIGPGKDPGSWILLPSFDDTHHTLPKREFWSNIWDAEAETLENSDYWKRDESKQILRMLCGSPSMAEDLIMHDGTRG